MSQPTLSDFDSPDTPSSESSTLTAEPYTYTATLYGPLYFDSTENGTIRTDPIVSATALMHAIGYEYADLAKLYVHRQTRGRDQTATPSYGKLRSLPFVTSEMVPIDDVTPDTPTFRTTSHTGEHAIVSEDSNVRDELDYPDPMPPDRDGSNAMWHRMREFLGVGLGTKYTFTIWYPDTHSPPPDTLRFATGIGRRGKMTATQTEPVDTVTVNQYLLDAVYDIADERLRDLIRVADEYRRGNEQRTVRFHGVDREWFQTNIIEPESLLDY